MAAVNLTAARMRALIAYDPETGAFVRLVTTNSLSKAGMSPGGIADDGYHTIYIDGRKYKAHRLAFLYMTGDWPIRDIDHINGHRADNRWSNLRLASREMNTQNLRGAIRSNSTGFLGVSRDRHKFRAIIHHKGKLLSLGTYATPQEAHAVYLDAKRRLHVGCTI